MCLEEMKTSTRGPRPEAARDVYCRHRQQTVINAATLVGTVHSLCFLPLQWRKGQAFFKNKTKNYLHQNWLCQSVSLSLLTVHYTSLPSFPPISWVSGLGFN